MEEDKYKFINISIMIIVNDVWRFLLDEVDKK